MSHIGEICAFEQKLGLILGYPVHMRAPELASLNQDSLKKAYFSRAHECHPRQGGKPRRISGDPDGQVPVSTGSLRHDPGQPSNRANSRSSFRSGITPLPSPKREASHNDSRNTRHRRRKSRRLRKRVRLSRKSGQRRKVGDRGPDRQPAFTTQARYPNRNSDSPNICITPNASTGKH